MLGWKLVLPTGRVGVRILHQALSAEKVSKKGGPTWGLTWVSGLPVVVKDCSLIQGEQLSLRGHGHALVGSG